jgi:NAD(P)-dependent dehydrogenase (short-subunit alcohol dehydrogenase family)
MDGPMQGKVALVTGGGSGIGRQTALAFARKGAKVAITDVADAAGNETVKMIKDMHGDALYVRADVSKPEDMERTVQEIVRQFGRLDYACNNAGIGGASNTVAEYKPEDWNKVISVNLTGVFLSLKYELMQMLKQGHGGAIVNISSILGQVGFASAPAYTAAKHGVIGLTEVAAIENGKTGVRINAICPGFIKTPMVAGAGMAEGSAGYNAIAGLHPMGRFGDPDEIANVVVWLCSDEASFVTGEAFRVDGGYVAQ